MASHKNARADNNDGTTVEEIEAAARKAGVLTVSMLARKLSMSEGTIRNRLQNLKIAPKARIHPKGRGRPTLGYSIEIADQLADYAGQVSVEILKG